MSTTLFVGLHGPAEAGKDTFADYALITLKARGASCMRAAFADPIRNMLLALGVPSQYMTDRALKEQPIPELGVSYRELAQTLGDWGRERSPGFWISRMGRRVVDHAVAHGTPAVVLITDVRKADEAEWIRERGGLIVQLSRPGIQAVREHNSETPLAPRLVDMHVANDADLRSLMSRAGTLTDRLLQLRQERLLATI